MLERDFLLKMILTKLQLSLYKGCQDINRNLTMLLLNNLLNKVVDAQSLIWQNDLFLNLASIATLNIY